MELQSVSILTVTGSVESWICQVTSVPDPWHISIAFMIPRLVFFHSPGTILLPLKSPAEPGRYRSRQLRHKIQFTSLRWTTVRWTGADHVLGNTRFRWKNVGEEVVAGAARLIPSAIVTTHVVLSVRTTDHRIRPLVAGHASCPPTSPGLIQSCSCSLQLLLQLPGCGVPSTLTFWTAL